MDATWLALALVVLLLLVALAGLRARGRPSPDSQQSSGLDTLAAWEPQATRVLTTPERLAMRIAEQALPEYLVLAQVPLARFLRVPTRHSYSEWLRRVGQLCPDLLVCDGSSQVLAVIEVRPPARRMTERAKARTERMRRVLKAAGIPMHLWVEDALPTVAAARASLLPREAPRPLADDDAMPEDPSAPPTIPLAASMSSAAASPRGAEGVGVAQVGQASPTFDASPADDRHALREPPPSTWFDELGPAEPSARPVTSRSPSLRQPGPR